MRFTSSLGALLVALPIFAPAFALPQSTAALQNPDALAILDQPVSEASDLWKRKGGGGGGGRGGGGGGGGGGRSSSGGSGSSGGGRSSGSSNAGGATRAGSGAPKNYGGGRYYGGGATAPYSAGGRSPRGLVAAPLLGVALLAYPGIWLYGAYAYPYGNPYSFRNRTARRNATATATPTSATPSATAPTRRSIVDHFVEIERRQASEEGVNETKPVTCLCAMYSVCGCDDNGDTTFLDSVIGDGDYFKLNQTLVQVSDINGTSTIVLNGTLPNGTTSAGGEDDVAGSASTLNVGGSVLGYWVMIALIGFTCFLV